MAWRAQRQKPLRLPSSRLRRSRRWLRLLRFDQDAGQGDPSLGLVLTLPVLIRGLADFVGFEEKQLGDALVGVNLGRKRRRVGYFDGEMAFPLAFERSDVDYNAAARIRGFSEADAQYLAR